MTPPTLSWETLYGIAEWVIRIGALVVIPFRRKFTAAAWLLLIFFLPIPGMILFWMIGQPRFPQERIDRFKELRPSIDGVADKLRGHAPSSPSAVAAFAERLGHFPATDGNQVDLIDDYDQVIRRLIEDIEGAKRCVFLLVYIFADDRLGKASSRPSAARSHAASIAACSSIRSAHSTGCEAPSSTCAILACARARHCLGV
jgi:cardiolipin synthase